MFGKFIVKPAVMPSVVTVDLRRVGEAVERDELAERLDERERPGERELREADVDLRLRAHRDRNWTRSNSRIRTTRSRSKSSSGQVTVTKVLAARLDRQEQVPGCRRWR